MQGEKSAAFLPGRSSRRFGALRRLADQPERARKVLIEAGVTVAVTRVVAVAMDDAQKAEALLEAHGFNKIPPTDIYRI